MRSDNNAAREFGMHLWPTAVVRDDLCLCDAIMGLKFGICMLNAYFDPFASFVSLDGRTGATSANGWKHGYSKRLGGTALNPHPQKVCVGPVI